MISVRWSIVKRTSVNPLKLITKKHMKLAICWSNGCLLTPNELQDLYCIWVFRDVEVLTGFKSTASTSTNLKALDDFLWLALSESNSSSLLCRVYRNRRITVQRVYTLDNATNSQFSIVLIFMCGVPRAWDKNGLLSDYDTSHLIFNHLRLISNYLWAIQ